MSARRWGKTQQATERAPLGTLAPACGGGYWTKTPQGWQWSENGSTFPRLGGDWTGILLRPAAATPTAADAAKDSDNA